MAVKHTLTDSSDFLLLAENVSSRKDVSDNAKTRIQFNNAFMALNKHIREVIASGDVEQLIKTQRQSLQFTSDVYGREGDLQSLDLLGKVEEQFKLIQNPDKYKKNLVYTLGEKNAAALKKAPDDIVEQFTKRQRANMTRFSGTEMPAEKQFFILQKDMANTMLNIYKVQQNQALGLDTGKKKTKGLER